MSQLTDLFSDIADAIRTKTGSTDQIVASNFPTAISQISSGLKYEVHNASDVKSGNSLILPELIDKDVCAILMYPTENEATLAPGVFVWALIEDGAVSMSCCGKDKEIKKASNQIESYDKNSGTLTARYYSANYASMISRISDNAVIVTIY